MAGDEDAQSHRPRGRGRLAIGTSVGSAVASWQQQLHSASRCVGSVAEACCSGRCRLRRPPADDAAKQRKRGTLVVMSFNLRVDNSADTRLGRGWPERRAKVANAIANSGADVVGTQEGLAHQLRNLSDDLEGLGMQYSCFGRAREVGFRFRPVGEHCAVWYRGDNDPLERLTDATFALSETPERLGSKSWGTACPRIATYAWFLLGGDSAFGRDRCVLYLNTHLDHSSVAAQEMGARLIVRRLHELEVAGPPRTGCVHSGTIVTGDFNSWQRRADGQCSPAFSVFKDAGFRDACSEAADPETCPFETFHDWRPAAKRAAPTPPTLRRIGIAHGHIDWILWRGTGLKLASFRVLTDDPDDGGAPPASDHFPVLAEFQTK